MDGPPVEYDSLHWNDACSRKQGRKWHEVFSFSPFPVFWLWYKFRNHIRNSGRAETTVAESVMKPYAWAGWGIRMRGPLISGAVCRGSTQKKKKKKKNACLLCGGRELWSFLARLNGRHSPLIAAAWAFLVNLFCLQWGWSFFFYSAVLLKSSNSNK